MKDDEREAAADFMHDFRDDWIAWVWRGGGQGCSTANDSYSLGADTLGYNALAHVVTQNNYASGLLEGATMHLFPAMGPNAGLHDVSCDGHLWIEIGNAVNKRATRDPRDECPGNPSDRWVRHRQNNVRLSRQDAGYRQSEI